MQFYLAGKKARNGAGSCSELRSTARQIQSKRMEFVCPSSIRPMSCWLGTALDGQTDISEKEQTFRRQPVHCLAKWREDGSLRLRVSSELYTVSSIKYRVIIASITIMMAGGRRIPMKCRLS